MHAILRLGIQRYMHIHCTIEVRRTHNASGVIYPVRPHETFSFLFFSFFLFNSSDFFKTMVMETNKFLCVIKVIIVDARETNNNSFVVSIVAIKCLMR